MSGNLLRHSQGFMHPGLLNTADGYPTLCVKAFNGRLLLIFVDSCLHSLEDLTRTAEIVNACVAARALRSWFDLVERSPRFLDRDAQVELHGLAMKFVFVLERLAVVALRANKSRWRLQPKLHAFIHIAEDHLRHGINCRFYHCFCDEDHIGLSKRLCQKVHRGDLMELRVLCRWLLRLATWDPVGGT